MMLTNNDHLAMHQQGYCLDPHDDGFRLKKLPVSHLFKDDADAWLYVFDLAWGDDPLAIRVLDFLGQHGPREFALIGHYAAIYRGTQLAALTMHQ